jgi:putative ABC transport system substrate-binding protein
MRRSLSTMERSIVGIVVILTLGLLAAPLPANAQQAGKVYRLGWLGVDESQSAIRAFLEHMRALGWIEGQHFIMEYQTVPNRHIRDRAPALAAALIRRNVDVIVAITGPGAIAAAKAETTIPVVIATGVDPIAHGLIASFARPGGNVTGLTAHAGDGYTGKRLQVFQETVPEISRVAVLLTPLGLKENRAEEIDRINKHYRDAAQLLGLTPLIATVEADSEYAAAFAMFTREHADAMYVTAGNLNGANVQRIMDFALPRRLPIMTNAIPILHAGGLVYYGPDWLDLRGRTAFYVDKILKGAKPGDLPVMGPEKFSFIVNLKTAKQLGITIPSTVLFQATEVIR